ncbi:hypothetical protein [Lacinutrix algicola]|uniref:hypothetical protein n=1 Tax=Lacinutrix algicola TaxID=342954 RepID=UPI0006E148DA|nr:hypothetical protein [Lacinutrix algicola]
MKIAFKITKVINYIALLLLFLGPYGIAFTGGLQVLASLIFVILFPKNKFIYVYFGLVITFFLLWNGEFNWLFGIPIFLIVFLTYIIQTQKIQL